LAGVCKTQYLPPFSDAKIGWDMDRSQVEVCLIESAAAYAMQVAWQCENDENFICPLDDLAATDKMCGGSVLVQTGSRGAPF
jgi:hypothetical protein